LFIQTFESGNVAPGQIVGCNTPVDADSNDDCFSPGDILPGIAFSTDPDFGGTILSGPFLFSNLNPANILLPDGSAQKSVITFPDNSVRAVGLELGCLFDQGVGGPCTGQTMLVQVYGAGNALLGETIVPVDSLFETFVGINTDEQIERITFIDADLSVLSFNAVEKVYFPNEGLHNIPTISEYGAAALALALGLAAAYAVRRKRASCA
ncbi:MAG TPA: IPTL-CTERM sorting domain-containing protein, partial [Thermodesulfobacteriota bacterium]|nr:IPTL-CTERM sorting domain-containing protein [Thermodesulfobacteriota bacterium]